jgi:H+/Cl- antiporter ClcA
LSLKDRLWGAIIGIGVALLSIPVAIIVAILLVPFWSWLEATSGIESLGHSGPAEWCYLVVYILVVSICGWIWMLLRKKNQNDSVKVNDQA